MRHPERACFTPGLVADGQHFQRWLRRTYGGLGRARPPFRHLVLRSAAGGAWNLGGDLSTFTRLIRARDAGKLRAYAHSTIELLHDHYKAYDLPITTVALIQGDAVGGGFEALLTNDVGDRRARRPLRLPRDPFGLFPGMGAYSFLKRRLGERQARTLIEDGKTRTADELHQLGLIDVLCEKGEGEAAVRRYAAEQAPRFETALTLAKVRRRADPVTRGGAGRHRRDVGRRWRSSSASPSCAAWTPSPATRSGCGRAAEKSSAAPKRDRQVCGGNRPREGGLEAP